MYQISQTTAQKPIDHLPNFNSTVEEELETGFKKDRIELGTLNGLISEGQSGSPRPYRRLYDRGGVFTTMATSIGSRQTKENMEMKKHSNNNDTIFQNTFFFNSY